MMMELAAHLDGGGKSVLFITTRYGAVFLSDRIVVLSERPGRRAVREIEVDLPRPRNAATMAEKPFVEHCNELWALFSER